MVASNPGMHHTSWHFIELEMSLKYGYQLGNVLHIYYYNSFFYAHEMSDWFIACHTNRSISFCSNYVLVLFTSVRYDCGPPLGPHCGFLEIYTDTTEDSVVFYGCFQGYVPEGRWSSVCTRNGWCPDPAALNCIAGM